MKRFDLYSVLVSCRCSFCGAPCGTPSGLCDECKKRISDGIRKGRALCPRCNLPLSGSDALCPFCGRMPGELEAMVSCGYFQGALKELVVSFKKDSPCYAYFLGSILFQTLKERGWEGWPIIPIPPRKGKIRRQGWDQVRFLSGILKHVYGMTVVDCLKRTDKVQQKSLDYEQRLRHMKQCLVLSGPGRISGKEERVIVLDDIFTSGATIAAAAGLLKSGLGVEVYGAVLCSVI